MLASNGEMGEPAGYRPPPRRPPHPRRSPHPDKTRIVHLHKGAEGFDFLGFHLRKCESRSGQASGGCCAGHRNGPWHRSAPRSASAPHATMRICPWSGWSPTSTACCAAGPLLPLRQLVAAVHGHRLLRAAATGPAGQRQTRPPRTQLDHALQLRMVPASRRCLVGRNRPLRGCVCQAVNGVGEPCAGKPHARFEGEGLATGRTSTTAV
jgi:hypothetical protein